jgi:hypothetical protein
MLIVITGDLQRSQLQGSPNVNLPMPEAGNGPIVESSPERVVEVGSRIDSE